MARGTTVRFVLTILSAVLLALQLPSPTASFASAHQNRATAAGSPEAVSTKREGEADQAVTRGGIGQAAGPAGPLRGRDRQRASADFVPEPATIASPAHQVTSVPPPTGHHASPRLSRSSTAHSPAALQVFRR
jgi:hypothetical protein